MLSRSLFLHKLNAMMVSLGVFAFFGGCLWLLTRLYLYPDYLFWLDGGFQGMRLVLAVDLVLGPLMAFIIYNPAKPRRELLTDIALLAVIQFSAMAWGVYQVWGPQPIAVVYGDDRFVAVIKDDIAPQHKTEQDLSDYSDLRPPLIYRREPQGKDEVAQFLGMMFQRDISPAAQVWLYEKFEPNREKIFARSADVLRHVEASMDKEWQAWLVAHRDDVAAGYQLAFFQGRYGDAVLVFAKGGGVVGYLPLTGKAPALGAQPLTPAS